MKFKGTKNWRIRDVEDFFFIEADLPNAEETGKYPRIEVMQEDFGDHNGYTELIRRHDALLISKAHEMLYLLNDLLQDKGINEVSRREIELLIKKATTL